MSTGRDPQQRELGFSSMESLSINSNMAAALNLQERFDYEEFAR